MAPTVITPKPYRRYLTSALHSRFLRAAFLAIVNAFVITVWTAKFDFFWSWFPFGPAGVKAVLFTFSSLFVFILQIATLRIGYQTNASLPHLAQNVLLNLTTYQTVFWYILSAFWFCEVYIWSVPEDKQLGWIVREDFSSPDRLNERPIYLKFFFVSLAIMQSGMHLYHNYSDLHIPVSKPSTLQTDSPGTHPIAPITTQFWKALPQMVKMASLCAGINTITAPFLYKAFFRNAFWQFHLAFAKPFFSMSRADASPPDTYFIGTILGSAFAAGVLLTFTWQFSVFAFLAFIGQQPVKDGSPISAASNDPNGTLLNGLRAKRDVVKSFAFWELAIISQRYPDRRKAIFADFERADGPVWASMHDAALKVISQIDDRILALQPSPTKPMPPAQVPQGLPRIARDPLQQNIFAALPPPSTRTQKVEDFLAMTNARALGQSKEPWRPPIGKTGQQLIGYAKTEIEQRTDTVIKCSKPVSSGLLGRLAYAKASKHINCTVLGAPVGNAAIIVDAIEAVTKMLVASLNEDEYGKVVQTVPTTIKQFTRTVSLIEGCVLSNAQHLEVGEDAKLQDVLIVIERLKGGLRELLSAFQLFLNDVGLGIKDLNDAKRVVEERDLLPQLKRMQPQAEKRSDADISQKQSSSSKSGEETVRQKSHAREREDSRTRRLEPSRRQLNGDGNVFRAKDLSQQPSQQREMEMVQ